MIDRILKTLFFCQHYFFGNIVVTINTRRIIRAELSVTLPISYKTSCGHGDLDPGSFLLAVLCFEVYFMFVRFPIPYGKDLGIRRCNNCIDEDLYE